VSITVQRLELYCGIRVEVEILADTTSKLVTLDVPSAAVAAWSGQCAYKASYPGTYDLYF
jgi:hypothetical protein